MSTEKRENWLDESGESRTERRRKVHLTEKQIDEITSAAARQAVGLMKKEIHEVASAAAKEAVEIMITEGYAAVGRNIVQKGFYVLGVVALGLFSLGVGKGWIKL